VQPFLRPRRVGEKIPSPGQGGCGGLMAGHEDPRVRREAAYLLGHGGVKEGVAPLHRLLQDDDAAEDVLQDTWMVALRHPPARQDSLGGWLRTVTRHLALKRLRGEARRARREERSACWESMEVTAEAQTAEERARIFRSVTEAVLALEEPYRNTVLRRHFEDLPPREIARSEGLPVSTVKSRLQRAYARLRSRLSRDLDEGEEPWTRALALCFGLRAPALPLPTPDGAAPAPTSLSITALMAAKTSILAIGGTLSLVALDLPRGSEVLVASNTYIATILAIVHAGHKPVLVEPDLRTYNIDPNRLADALTSRTRAVCVTHLYGKPCRMDAIRQLRTLTYRRSRNGSLSSTGFDERAGEVTTTSTGPRGGQSAPGDIDEGCSQHEGESLEICATSCPCLSRPPASRASSSWPRTNTAGT